MGQAVVLQVSPSPGSSNEPRRDKAVKDDLKRNEASVVCTVQGSWLCYSKGRMDTGRVVGDLVSGKSRPNDHEVLKLKA